MKSKFPKDGIPLLSSLPVSTPNPVTAPTPLITLDLYVFPFFFFFLATPCGMWDLSFLTKDWTLFWKHRVLTTGLPGKSCFSLGFSASLSLPVYLCLSGYLSIYTYIYLHLETSLVAQMVKRLSTMRETWFDPWVGKIPWRRKRLSTKSRTRLSDFHFHLQWASTV